MTLQPGALGILNQLDPVTNLSVKSLYIAMLYLVPLITIPSVTLFPLPLITMPSMAHYPSSQYLHDTLPHLLRKANQVKERSARHTAMLKAELEVEKERNLTERRRRVALKALVTECEVRAHCMYWYELQGNISLLATVINSGYGL